jgi:alpha-amylase
MQDEAYSKIYQIGEKVLKTKDENLIKIWRSLQTSDHFYYMCTKWFSDGDVHIYFNPYDTPYEAFINYMNVVSDFEILVDKTSERPATVKKSATKTTAKKVAPKAEKTIVKKSKSTAKKTVKKTSTQTKKKSAVTKKS